VTDAPEATELDERERTVIVSVPRAKLWGAHTSASANNIEPSNDLAGKVLAELEGNFRLPRARTVLRDGITSPDCRLNKADSVK
jgi:hypothetical protein